MERRSGIGYVSVWPLVAILCGPAVAAAQERPADTLPGPGESIERNLAGGETHAYTIELAAGHFLRVCVDQRGIDVVVEASASDEPKLVEMDTPGGGQGSERVGLIAREGGTHRLVVRSLNKNAPAGRYVVRIDALRQATPEDHKWVAALQSSSEADVLRRRRTAESLAQSIDVYLKAVRLWREVGDPRGEARTLGTLADAYDQTGETQKAMESFTQARSLARDIGERWMEAEMVRRIGGVYNETGETQRALDVYVEALALCREAGDREGEAATLVDVGVAHARRGDRQKAQDHYLEALPLFRGFGDRWGEGDTLHNIGMSSNALGDTQGALSSFRRALEIWREIGNRRGEANVLNALGGLYGDLGEPKRALEYQEQAVALARAAGDRRAEAATLNNMGMAWFSLDENEKALEYLERSLAIAAAVGNRHGEAYTLTGIGRVHAKQGEDAKALEYYDRAIAVRRAVGDRRGEALTLILAGDVHGKRQDVEKALGAHGEALRLARAVADRKAEARALHGIARVELQRGRLEQAHPPIAQALEIVESLRTLVTNRELRASYFATVQEHYELYVDIAMRRHEAAPSAGHDGEALRAWERARARSLVDMLGEARADIRIGVSASLLEHAKGVRQRLSVAAERQTRLLNGPHTDEQAQTASKEVAVLVAEYEAVEAETQAETPAYAALTQPRSLGLGEIQALLDDKTLLLEYALGPERSHLWVVGPRSLDSYALPPRAEIERAARRVNELLTARNREPVGEDNPQRRARVKRAEDDYPEAAAALAEMVLGPAAVQLGTRRLLIVADGALQYVPFSALPRPDALRSATPGRQQWVPLISDHEIVSLPSASTLGLLRDAASRRRPSAGSVAVLADPVFERTDERVSGARGKGTQTTGKADGVTDLERSAMAVGIQGAGGRIARLPFTRREAEAIVATATGKDLLALDFEANRSAATRPELGDYRVVHFATHGLINSEHPQLSGVVLSLVDKNGEPQDGFLRLSDVYNLKLSSTELVVLSACQTALGKDVKGEGLVGLTRGFMYAGVPRVLASLWKVDDAATCALMTRFYEAMFRDGLHPAAALRIAQGFVRGQRRWQAPYFWAAFTLQGEWN